MASEIAARVHRAIRATPSDEMLFRKQLSEGATEMLRRLCEVYAPLEGAGEPPLVDELTAELSQRVLAFIQSTAAGVRGRNIGAVQKLVANLEKNVRLSAARTFKLAAYDAHKDDTKPAPPPALPKADEDARAAFERLPLHPDTRAACAKQFADGHYRESILNAGIELVQYVKKRAAHPTDKKNGNALDNTPLMQRVFGGNAPILKVNEMQTSSDQDEQQGMMFLFAGATMGLRNPRAHSLDPDTPEYAVEAIAFLSFLRKVAEASKE
ncbi:MAG: TIGR02391 family protein [Deltaproteobacteria bacterium]|nr:TIGR02391 family protein [Deltaproteobacteria bacterium]